MTQSILIIDDEADIRDILADIFDDEGYNIHKAAHSEQALSIIQSNDIDLIVLDIWLDNSDMDGMQILKHLKSGEHKDVPILMISGHGNVEMAVNAMKIGAFDFIEKPFKIDHILLTVNRALEQKSLKEENSRLKEQDINTPNVDHNYKSPSMISLMKSIQDNAASDARVMISGDKGTGKSYLARIIHDISHRSKKPLTIVNCYDLSLESLNDEFIEADSGTLLLENIETLSPDIQSELLNIITKNEITCRIIATCDSDIANLITEQKFSSALYDRLSVMKYSALSLQERSEDIEILLNEFALIFCKEFHIEKPTFTPSFIASIKKHDWQGNIRQLKIAVEWMMMSHYVGADDLASLDSLTLSSQASTKSDNVISYTQKAETEDGVAYDLPLKQARDDFEKKYLMHMLHRFDGNIAQVAQHIDMERTALYRKLKSMNISYNDDVQITKAN